MGTSLCDGDAAFVVSVCSEPSHTQCMICGLRACVCACVCACAVYFGCNL